MRNFWDVYEESLLKAVTTYPQEYGFGPTGVAAVRKKMEAAYRPDNTGWNHNGRAFKLTCATLKIPYTRKAMIAYIEACK